jgi:hypothetical protein
MKASFLKQLCFLMLIFSITKVHAQNENKFDFERIEDNSFLLEEAYNQEPGVIQHISAFQYMNNNTWAYSFTEEWPVPGQKHQLSFTFLMLEYTSTGIGDVALNYRYQAIFSRRIAFSPRASVLFPTGNYKKSQGNGVLGYQLNLPVSYICSRKLVTHFNLGATYIPGAKSENNTISDVTIINYGTSAIVLISKTLNFMFEAVGFTTIRKSENAETEKISSFLINPGFRYAINCKSGLQIVPGVAVPIGIGKSNEVGVFVYLSFEHPLWKP